jgi:peroxiredoxin
MKAVLSLALVLSGLLAMAAAEETASPVGKKVDNFQLRDYRGAERSLQDFADQELVVLVFTGTECPVAKLYAPRLGALAQEFGPKGVAFIGVNAKQQDSITAIGQYAKTHGIAFPILKDVGNVLADQLKAQRTPEVFVLDGQRVIRYWGRIDDQYGVGYVRPKPERRDLAVALEELLASKPVSVAVTRAPGCFIGRVQPETKQGDVTYSKHIAGIIQKHCLECHRRGRIAPFSLTSYEQVAGWADTIREVIEDGRMPPWHADPRYGEFANDCHLPEKDKQLIFDWIKNGAPKGDPKDLPRPAEFAEGWRIPKPDMVISMPKPFKVPAEGTVTYQFIAVDPGFTEDKWVQAAEVKPGCRPVVHHILVFVQPPGGSGTDRHGGFITNWLAATVPGARPHIFPEGTAKLIPAGSRLLFQIHYTPNGVPQEDQSCVGLVFADPKTVKKEVSTEMVVNSRIQIPPHDPNYRLEATATIDKDSLLLTMMPHTHLRGKAFKYEAIYPNGDREVLLDVPRYDFNWQNSYVLAKPKVLTKGTQLHCVAYYDNSKNNRSNPNPDATVRWGDQTWQEMMIGYFDVIPLEQDLLQNPRPINKIVRKEGPALAPELKQLAQGALASQESFDAFARAVQKAQPKIDRVCVTSCWDGKLKVEKATYTGDVTPHIAETGFEQSGRLFALAHYALRGLFMVHPDLKTARGADLAMISKTLASSVHVPVVLEGKPATVNFWSREGDAFPEETHGLLRAVAEAVAGEK